MGLLGKPTIFGNVHIGLGVQSPRESMIFGSRGIPMTPSCEAPWVTFALACLQQLKPWNLEKTLKETNGCCFCLRWFFVWFRLHSYTWDNDWDDDWVDISNIMTFWYTDCHQILLGVDLLVMCLRRKAASPRNVNNAHQLPGSASRLTPLELDANLQADPSASYHMETRVRSI